MSVTVDLLSDCGQVLTGTTTTGSNGVASFVVQKSIAESGAYTVDVTVDDPAWDGSGDTSSCSVTNANGTCQ